MKYHPDQTKGDPQSVTKFRAITEAYQTLSNVKKRQLYDKGFHFSHVAASPQQQAHSKSVYQNV